jgi:signal transduction histidine kinase
VNSVYVDRSGTVWAGTNHGLCRLDQASHTFTSYFASDGLADSAVKGILEDERGDLWLSTTDGLSRFNPRTGTARNYYAADGLPGNEFRFAAASKSSTGEMFFGSSRGLLAFFPERVTDNTSPPPVVLTDFWLFGDRWRAGKDPLQQSISFTRSLTFSPSQDIFSFEFSAISYSDPTRNRYRYRLEGLEKQWNERDSTRRFVTYTTLAPGDYVFRVQGSNSLGVWNTTGATVQIKVLGPWWTWWWVRALFMLLTLTAVVALFRLRVRRLAYQLNLRFEERLAERTRIARELHDTLLQGFLSASIHVGIAADALPQDSGAKPMLNRGLELMDGVIDEARNALSGLRSSPSDSLDLADAFAHIPEELGSREQIGKAVDFRLIVKGQQRPVHPVLRDEVYRIGREALTNAFRHSHAKKIEMELEYSLKGLCIRVRDDGCGIDAHVVRSGKEGHFGVSGMRERADLMGAQFRVMSGAAAGTEIELSVPGHIAFQSESDGKASWFGKHVRRQHAAKKGAGK